MLPNGSPKKKRFDRDSLFVAFGIYGAAGLQLVVALLAGAFLGQWLDRKWGTEPWLLIVGLFVGCTAGFYQLFRLIQWKSRER